MHGLVKVTKVQSAHNHNKQQFSTSNITVGSRNTATINVLLVAFGSENTGRVTATIHVLLSSLPVVLSLKVADRDKPGTTTNGKLVLYKREKIPHLM